MRILQTDILYPLAIVLLMGVIIYLTHTKEGAEEQMTETDKKIRVHEEYCKYLTKLYANKNSDYGDSFSRVRKEIPNAILIRIADKYHRLLTLLSRGESDVRVKSESIDDTLLDLANYCLLELIERRTDEEQSLKDSMYE